MCIFNLYQQNSNIIRVKLSIVNIINTSESQSLQSNVINIKRNRIFICERAEFSLNFILSINSAKRQKNYLSIVGKTFYLSQIINRKIILCLNVDNNIAFPVYFYSILVAVLQLYSSTKIWCEFYWFYSTIQNLGLYFALSLSALYKIFSPPASDGIKV